MVAVIQTLRPSALSTSVVSSTVRPAATLCLYATSSDTWRVRGAELGSKAERRVPSVKHVAALP